MDCPLQLHHHLLLLLLHLLIIPVLPLLPTTLFSSIHILKKVLITPWIIQFLLLLLLLYLLLLPFGYSIGTVK